MFCLGGFLSGGFLSRGFMSGGFLSGGGFCPRTIFSIGCSVLGKKVLKIAPPSIQKFDLEDTRKLVAIIAASDMMTEYLIK